ncbi:hypothetical protein [Fluviicola sp.]
MAQETKKNRDENVQQPNPEGMKETAKKTDRREPKKGLPINSPGRESSKS